MRRHRAGDQRRQPALGGQHPDHQRRDARASADRHRDRRRLRGHRDRCRRAQQRRPGRRRGAGPLGREGRPGEPVGRGRQAARRAGRRRRCPASAGTRRPAETSIGVFSSMAPALGEVFVRARAEGRELFGFAEHQMSTVYLGTSTGVRVRHAQPTGRIEVTGKTSDWSRSSWVGQSTRDFSDVDVTQVDAELARRLGLGGPPGRPGGRALRDAAAAQRGRRPARLPLLDRGRPRGRRRPHRLQPARAAAPGSASGWPTRRCGSGATRRRRVSSATRWCSPRPPPRRSRSSTTGCRSARPTGWPTAS